MKDFLFILFLIIFSSCGSLAPTTYTYPVDMVKAKVTWDKTIKELEDKCLNTTGVRVDPASAPPGKNYRYFCELRKFPNTRDKKLLLSDPYFGYSKRSSRGGGSMIWFDANKYYLDKTGIETIWKEKFAYVSWMYSYVLKNGYTFLTLGLREPWADTKYKGDPSYLIRIEGFSQNPSPNLDEIYGKKVDVALASTESISSKFKKFVKSNHSREKRIQEGHNQVVYRERARDKARRRSQNRKQNSAWDTDYINFRNKMLNNKQDKKFFKALNSVSSRPKRAKSYSRPSLRYKKSSRSYAPSTATTKRSFSKSYNKKTIAKSFPGRSGKLNSKKVDISKISCVTPYASPVKGVHDFYLIRGGSVAAGGPYCEHFRPRQGVRDCSGHKKRHAEDFKLRGKKHCEKLRNGMTYVS
ncbi:MAG: hypothetical protein KC493_14005, partial [Bacteriovoracaceae bacterium]|nr:hypothetical protein [Bacteriovoracaceae bacterium]